MVVGTSAILSIENCNPISCRQHRIRFEFSVLRHRNDCQIRSLLKCNPYTHHRCTTTCDNKMRIHARYDVNDQSETSRNRTKGEEAEFQLTCLNFIGPDGSDEPAESTSQRFRLAHFPFYPSAMPDESVDDEGCDGLPPSETTPDRQEYSAETFRSNPARNLATKPRLSHIKSESLTQFR